MPRAKVNTKETTKTKKSKATAVAKEKTVKKTTVKKKQSSSVKSKRKINKVECLATKRNTTSVKASKGKVKSIKTDNFVNLSEYYDLPYRYNETVVKILAQTPKVLFVYWDISDNDREKFKHKYGEYFFNDTYPVLVVHNKTLNYYQEVEINDFANSWYLNITDSKSEYSVTLGRRFKEYVNRNPDMPHKEDIGNLIEVCYSNDLVMPNDHMLLDELPPKVKYRNVKTNEETTKDTRFVLADNKLINFYNLYKEIYKLENVSQIFDLNNPSSGNPTSSFKI